SQTEAIESRCPSPDGLAKLPANRCKIRRNESRPPLADWSQNTDGYSPELVFLIQPILLHHKPKRHRPTPFHPPPHTNSGRSIGCFSFIPNETTNPSPSDNSSPRRTCTSPLGKPASKVLQWPQHLQTELF